VLQLPTAISVLLLFLAVSRPGYATCGTVIFLGLRHENPRRPTYHRIFYMPYGSLTASLQTVSTSPTAPRYFLRKPFLWQAYRPSVAMVLPTAYGLWQYDTFFLQSWTIDIQNRKVLVPGSGRPIVIGSAMAAAHGDFSTVTIFFWLSAGPVTLPVVRYRYSQAYDTSLRAHDTPTIHTIPAPRKPYQSLVLFRPYYLRYPGPSTQAFFYGGRPTVADLQWLLPTAYGLQQYGTFLRFQTIDLQNHKVPGTMANQRSDQQCYGPYGNFRPSYATWYLW